MKLAGIYIIENKITKKLYIGSSIDVLGRMKRHRFLLRRNRHHNPHLQRAFNKYGDNNFEFKEIKIIEDYNHLIFCEQFFIDNFSSYKNGYNMCPKAGNILGYKHTPETIVKMKLVQKGCKNGMWRHKYTPEEINAMRLRNKGSGNGMYGKTHTFAVRKRLSEFRKGVEITDEFRETMSKATTGEKNGMFGKRHSIKAKESIKKKLKERGGYKGEKNPNYGHFWKNETREKLKKTIRINGGRYGDKNPMFERTKIPKSDWELIFQQIKSGEKEINQIAEKYNVCRGTVNNLLIRLERKE